MYEPCDFRGSYLPLDGRWGVTPLKGMSGMPTSRSRRSAPPERGMTYGARALWSRSLRSRRRWGKPTTWRRGTGGCRFERGRVRDAHNLTRVDGHPLESRGEIERLMPGSERGCRKSAISATRRQSTLPHARFGGGCGETQFGCAPCAYPTVDQCRRPSSCKFPSCRRDVRQKRALSHRGTKTDVLLAQGYRSVA
jgi:hypothetical protein